MHREFPGFLAFSYTEYTQNVARVRELLELQSCRANSFLQDEILARFVAHTVQFALQFYGEARPRPNPGFPVSFPGMSHRKTAIKPEQ